MAIAIARSCIRSGARGRFYNVVDLVNRLEIETRNGRQGRIAEHLTRMDFIVLDELGYLPFAQSGGQLLFHLVSRLYERKRPDGGAWMCFVWHQAIAADKARAPRLEIVRHGMLMFPRVGGGSRA
jgi:hypothetical protein